MTSRKEQYGAVEGGLAPLVPDGEYMASVIKTDVCMMFARALKLVITFRIAEGPHMGTDLQRYYNVKPGGRGKKGFKIGRHSQYLRDYVRLFGRPQRVDRMSLGIWKEHVFTITTTTVKTDSEGNKLPAELRYSKVDQVKIK